METGNGELAPEQPSIRQEVETRLVTETSRLVPRLLSGYLLDPNFTDYSSNIKPKLLDDIRKNKQALLIDGLHHEWHSAVEEDFPLHEYFNIPKPPLNRPLSLDSGWVEPLAPEMPEEYLEACEFWASGIDGDLSELDDFHKDFVEKPQLFWLIRSINNMAQSYERGTADKAFRMVSEGMHKPGYTLNYDGAQHLLAFMPPETSKLVSQMIAANQIVSNMEKKLDTSKLSDDELDMFESIKSVLMADALSGHRWYEFASKYGGFIERGPELAAISAIGVKSLVKAHSLAKRGNANDVIAAYVDAIGVSASSVKEMIESTPHREYCRTNPLDIVDTHFNEHLIPLFREMSSIRYSRFQHIKNNLKAVIVEPNISHAILWQSFVNEATVYETNEDIIYRSLDTKRDWLTNKAVGRCIIEIGRGDLQQNLTDIGQIIDLRLDYADDDEYPNFDLIVWTDDTEKLLTAESFIKGLVKKIDRWKSAEMNGSLAVRGPYQLISSTPRILVQIVTKEVRVPDYHLPFAALQET